MHVEFSLRRLELNSVKIGSLWLTPPRLKAVQDHNSPPTRDEMQDGIDPGQLIGWMELEMNLEAREGLKDMNKLSGWQAQAFRLGVSFLGLVFSASP